MTFPATFLAPMTFSTTFPTPVTFPAPVTFLAKLIIVYKYGISIFFLQKYDLKNPYKCKKKKQKTHNPLALFIYAIKK
ncbi:hypothetical protein CsatB_020819 [Cannabis sativa]